MNNHNLRSYGQKDIIKDLTEEDILYSIGHSYGIGNGSNADTPDNPDELADYERGIEEFCKNEEW